jgi:hypothetical protein
MTVKRLIELKTSSVNYTAEDVEAAHDELRRLAQKLVDRFGQTQAFEILSALADAVCPDGKAKHQRSSLFEKIEPQARPLMPHHA